MKRRLILLIDILTFIFVIPFFFCLAASTGLLLGRAFDLDSFTTSSTQTPAPRPIRRYVVLPRLTSAPAAVTEPDLALEAPAPPLIEVPAEQAQPLQPAPPIEHTPAPAVVPARAAMPPAPIDLPVQATLPETTAPLPVESPAAELAEPSIPAPADDLAVPETPADSGSPVAPVDSEASPSDPPAPGEEEVATTEPSPPADPAPPQNELPPPAQPAPFDPPAGLGSSFFDELLEQVKQ